MFHIRIYIYTHMRMCYKIKKKYFFIQFAASSSDFPRTYLSSLLPNRPNLYRHTTPTRTSPTRRRPLHRRILQGYNSLASSRGGIRRRGGRLSGFLATRRGRRKRADVFPRSVRGFEPAGPGWGREFGTQGNNFFAARPESNRRPREIC